MKDIHAIQQRYINIVNIIKTLGDRDIKPILMFQYRTDAVNDAYSIYTVLKVIAVAALIVQIGSFAALTAPIWVTSGAISMLAAGIIFTLGAMGLYLSTNLLPVSTLVDVLRGRNIGLLCIGALLKKFYRPILEKAKKDNLPILDLSNTFNPNDTSLYDHGIEPGKAGGALIAEGIHHIVANHDFTKESKLYSKSDGEDSYKAKDNIPKEWYVEYPSRKV